MEGTNTSNKIGRFLNKRKLNWNKMLLFECVCFKPCHGSLVKRVHSKQTEVPM